MTTNKINTYVKSYVKDHIKKIKTTVYEKINGNDLIFDYSKMSFWNNFFIFLFTVILWLCLISILGSAILERIINPVKFASDANIILEIYPENTNEKTETKYLIVEEYLKKQPYIESFERVEKAKIINMLKDFSGNFKDNKFDIQLPIIVIIKLKANNLDKIEPLRLNLSQKVNNTFLDTEKELLERLLGSINVVKYFVFLIPLLAIIILMSILFLIIYSVLYSNKETIETLIFLGIYKKTLIMEFGRWIFLNTLKSMFAALILTLFSILFLLAFSNLTLSAIPINAYLYFTFFIVFILPFLSMLLGSIFVKRIIAKSFEKHLV